MIGCLAKKKLNCIRERRIHILKESLIENLNIQVQIGMCGLRSMAENQYGKEVI